MELAFQFVDNIYVCVGTKQIVGISQNPDYKLN